MRRSPYRVLIAVLCSLCLLGAQQAAYAHALAHFAGVITSAGTGSGTDGDAPEHRCTTCAACAGLVSAPPLFFAPIVAAPASAGQTLATAVAAAPTHWPSPYIARAPPSLR